MLSVVLVEPHTPGNIGAVARAMKNFGFTRLVLVNPKCDHLSGEAYARAKHARTILKKALVLPNFKSLKSFDTRVATTAALGTECNVARLPLTPQNISEKYSELRRGSTALVFGREASGLTNEEVLACDFVVSIPSSIKYRALNVSHAVAILLYELSKKSRMKKVGENFVAASSSEKEVIFRLIDQLLARMPFHFDTQRDTQRKIWRRLIGKSLLSRREAFAVIGFFKKLEPLCRPQGPASGSSPKAAVLRQKKNPGATPAKLEQAASK